MATMRAWASFSATDVNNDNELDIQELKTLIWLSDGEEPDDRRVSKDLKLIDEDGSGTIDRMEWVSYLSSPDGFNYELKAIYDLNDVNNDGVIELSEFITIILTTFHKDIDRKSENGKLVAENVVRALAIELFKELD
jgi:hypothetical protein